MRNKNGVWCSTREAYACDCKALCQKSVNDFVKCEISEKLKVALKYSAIPAEYCGVDRAKL